MCGLLGFSFFIFVSSKGPALGYHYHAPILEVSGTSRESGSVRNNHASTYRSYSQRNAGNSWSVFVCHSQGKQYEATRQIGKRHEKWRPYAKRAVITRVCLGTHDISIPPLSILLAPGGIRLCFRHVRSSARAYARARMKACHRLLALGRKKKQLIFFFAHLFRRSRSSKMLVFRDRRRVIANFSARFLRFSDKMYYFSIMQTVKQLWLAVT